METVQRINFENPETNSSQVGFGIRFGDEWVVRSYHQKVFTISHKKVNYMFETYKRDTNFVKHFFKGEI
jgi:hypothetical protein